MNREQAASEQAAPTSAFIWLPPSPCFRLHRISVFAVLPSSLSYAAASRRDKLARQGGFGERDRRGRCLLRLVANILP